MSDLTCDLRLGRYQDVLGDVECDALIVDAPYSARTHGGHGEARLDYVSPSSRYRGAAPHSARRDIGYSEWSPNDVAEFCTFWGGIVPDVYDEDGEMVVPQTRTHDARCRGWWVTITDHVLAPVWADEMARQGLYVFSPLPWLAPGSRVRLLGDGPSSWTCWIVVGRPRTGEDRNGKEWRRWGTLPGGYVVTQERSIVVGNKPLALMEALVSDYSRPGDIVCDPTAGGGTTLLAARKLGRHAIGAEMDADTHRKASARLGLVDTSSELPLFANG